MPKAIEAIVRATKILDVLGDASDGMHLTDIARHLDIPKGSVYRVLATLSEQGYVQKDQDNSRYYLGVRILRLQNNIATRSNLVSIAIPYMNALALEMKEVVHLGVLNRERIVYVESRRPEHSFSSYPSLGHFAPAYCTALGKALLAHLPADELEEILPSIDFQSLTPNTITSCDDLRRELALTRQRGYAIDDEERDIGVRCIASPIYDHRNRVMAALSMSAPPQRMPHDQDIANSRKVLETCKRISSDLGARV